MAEPGSKTLPSGASNGPAKPPKPPNPVWRMMGLPNFRLRLPSRNWMIFLSISGSWTTAVVYDRREKRKIQQKWTKLVSHIAQEPLADHQQLPRKLTVYLAAPPADGLIPAREHFNEYVKPILVAAALDWDAVEGRREGDVRAGLAERIRKLRKKRGEISAEPLEEGVQEIMEDSRLKAGIKTYDGPGGDIVVGRHTWKEYVRGLHEGWLGPLDPPRGVDIYEAKPVENPTPDPSVVTDNQSPASSSDAIAVAPPPTIAEPSQADGSASTKEMEPRKKKRQLPPFILTAEYDEALLPTTCPQALGPSTIVPFPHLLGFWNFPIRMYRFLNRRKVADEVGRQTTAAILAAYRPYHTSTEEMPAFQDNDFMSRYQWEQQTVLQRDESEWHKTARKRTDGEGERVWLDPMVLDKRISERMRKFELDRDAEHRAQEVSVKEEPFLESFWSRKKAEKRPWEGLNDDTD